MIVLGEKSLSNLKGVHPDLVRVVKRAAMWATPSEDFTVLEGVRSNDRMCEIYGQGRTATECATKGVPARYARPRAQKVSWLNNPFMSEHRVQKDGWGHAVDIAPFPIDWSNTKRFDDLAKLMFEAAKIEAVNITWGADWDRDGNRRERGESDSPHFQLYTQEYA